MRLAPALVAGLLLLWPASVRGEEPSTRVDGVSRAHLDEEKRALLARIGLTQ